MKITLEANSFDELYTLIAQSPDARAKIMQMLDLDDIRGNETQAYTSDDIKEIKQSDEPIIEEEVKAENEPITEPESEPYKYTQDELAQFAAQIVDNGKIDELVALLHEFGVNCLPDLPEAKYDEFMTRASALEG